jgi:hypothetical protein
MFRRIGVTLWKILNGEVRFREVDAPRRFLWFTLKWRSFVPAVDFICFRNIVFEMISRFVPGLL